MPDNKIRIVNQTMEYANGTLTLPGNIAVGNLSLTFGSLTATSANVGALSALPILPAGYLVFNLTGNNILIPYYKP